MSQRFNVLIPAAGLATRMGSSKLWLKTTEGKTFVEHIVFEYAKLNPEVIVLVVNTQGFSELKQHTPIIQKCKMVVNSTPELGRMQSIQMGLGVLPENLPLFIHNIDNPFVPLDLLQEMIEELSERMIIIPTYEGKGGHPILLSKEVVFMLKEVTQETDFKGFIRKFSSHFIPTKHKSILLNINTPSDYQQYLG